MSIRSQVPLVPFPDVRLSSPGHLIRAFVIAWHENPYDTIAELSASCRLSRPTCYKLQALLRARGDVRGEVIDGSPVLRSSDVSFS